MLKMYNYKQFVIEVRKLSSPKDFEKNAEILETVMPEDQELFLSILKHGSDLIPADKIIQKLTLIANKNSLSKRQILSIGMEFRIVDHFFNKNN